MDEDLDDCLSIVWMICCPFCIRVYSFEKIYNYFPSARLKTNYIERMVRPLINMIGIFYLIFSVTWCFLSTTYSGNKPLLTRS